MHLTIGDRSQAQRNFPRAYSDMAEMYVKIKFLYVNMQKIWNVARAFVNGYDTKADALKMVGNYWLRCSRLKRSKYIDGLLIQLPAASPPTCLRWVPLGSLEGIRFSSIA